MADKARRGRPRKYAEGSVSYTVNFPLEIRHAIDLAAARTTVDSADIVREAVFRYLKEIAPDLLAPDNPETWDEAGWRAHALKHENFLGVPYDAKCLKCQYRYKSFQDFAKWYTGIGRAKPTSRPYIDKGLGSRIDPRSEKVFSTDNPEEFTDEDRALLHAHIAEGEHTDKEGNLRPWEYRGICKICDEAASLAEREQEINRNKKLNEDGSDTQIQE